MALYSSDLKRAWTTAQAIGHELGLDPVPTPEMRERRYGVFEGLTYDEAIGRGLKVMDLAAMALARDSRIPIIVFSIHEPGGFLDLLKGGGRATVVAG